MKSSKYDITSSSGKRLLWEEEPDNVPISSAKPADEGNTFMHRSLDSPDHKYMSRTHVQQKQTGINSPMSCHSIGLQTSGTAIGIPVHLQEKDGSPSVTPELPLLNAESKKCVRFECDPSESDSGTRDGNERMVGPQQSPYPTPLRLTDEMQTPATVFPAKVENIATGKNARIRSQYVYPVLNPIENSSQWNALKGLDTHQLGFSEDTSDLHKNYSSEFLAKTPMSCRVAADVLQQNENGPQPVEASLADWLKPVSASDKRSQSSFSSGKTPTARCSDIERPILGMVAAHWNDDEPSQISPKWWDGNGIPNSTNKYKEVALPCSIPFQDQKVSWHATPFEERLEKALSDERLFPQHSNSPNPPSVGCSVLNLKSFYGLDNLQKWTEHADHFGLNLLNSLQPRAAGVVHSKYYLLKPYMLILGHCRFMQTIEIAAFLSAEHVSSLQSQPDAIC
ncbi:hypothetical protein ACLOJK_021544 [Asimina triloba]